MTVNLDQLSAEENHIFQKFISVEERDDLKKEKMVSEEIQHDGVSLEVRDWLERRLCPQRKQKQEICCVLAENSLVTQAI